MAELTVNLADLKKGVKFAAGEPSQIKVVRAQRTRLIGMFFDLNKCFLLPSATLAIKSLVKTYEKHPKSEVLVVGHTDTSGQEAYNETLSLERAQAVAAYLTDKVEDWEAFFGEGKPAEKKWGLLEVQHMLTRLPQGKPAHYAGTPNGVNDAKHQNAVKAYQADKNLKVDGIAGPNTRKALITDYMALDGTSLPQEASLTVHGCGENFPVQETGDSVRSAENRRVEIFFFDGPITPPPQGSISKKGAKDYPEWLKAVQETIDLSVAPGFFEFDLPPQKKQILDPAIGDFEALEDASGQPILIAANDDNLVRSIIEQAREQDEKRGKDSSPKTRDFGDFVGFKMVDDFKQPEIRMDHGFLDDGKGNLDLSKMETPSLSDILSFQKWGAKLAAAQLLRPDLIDATNTYQHFRLASGADFFFSYEKFVQDDQAGKFIVESSVEDAIAAAIELNDLSGRDEFLMQTTAIGVGGKNGRYPYPGTENWQKAIGAHPIWIEAKIKVNRTDNERRFNIDLKINARDRYNFNPGDKDIASGTPDAENGRFELTGLGKEFVSKASLKRKIQFTTSLGPVADPRQPIGNKAVTPQR